MTKHRAELSVRRAFLRLALLFLLFLAGSCAAMATFTASTGASAPIVTAALAAPANLTGSGTTLTWAQSTSTWATGTRIYRSTTPGGTYLQVAQIANPATTSYIDNPGSGLFYYVVRAYYDGNGANWTSPDSNETSVATTTVLSLSPATAGAGATLNGSLNGLPRGETLTFRYDSLAGTVLSGSVDGATTPATLGSDTDSPVTVVLPGNATNGGHSIYAVASPSGQFANATVTVDAVPPPAPTFTSTPPAVSTSSSATFAFTDTEPGVTFNCSRDGGPYSSCTSPRTIVNLSDGSHTFAVTASDAYGNTSSPVTHTFVVDRSAPAAPTLTSTPAAATTSTSAPFSFTGGEPGGAFTCSLDGAAPTTCTSPVAYTVANGQHTFAVYAQDAAGNTSPATTYKWLVDTAGFRGYPTAPIDGAALSSSGYTAGCGTPSTGDICGVAISGSGRTVSAVYISLERVNGSKYWDGSSFGNGEVWLLASGTSSWSYALNVTNFQQSDYILRVKVVDSLNNTGIITNTAFSLDNADPTVALSTPSAGGAYSASTWTSGCGSAAVDDLCGTASDPVIGAAGGSGIGSVQVSVQQNSSGKYWDGAGFNGASATYYTANGTTSWSLPFDFADFPADGTYTARAIAYDGARNASPTTSVSFTIDRTAPTGIVIFPVSGSTYGTAAYTAGCGTAATNDFCGTASDPVSGVGQVRVSVQRGTGNYWNGSTFGSVGEVKFAATGTTSWSSVFALANFPSDGNYTIRAYVSDTAGNAAPSVSSTFILDKTPPPAPVITSAPANPTTATTATFSFTDSEVTATLTCSLDGAAASSCTSPTSYSGLTQGTHTFAVTARDVNGNTTTTNQAWVVDTAAPTAAITSPAASTAYGPTTWTALCSTAAADDACGTAADTGGSGVAQVQVSLQSSTSGLYWDGSGFTSAAEVRTPATGTTSWRWTFSGASFPATGNYVLRAYSVDNVGFVSAAVSRTFTWDMTAPTSTTAFPASGGLYNTAAYNAGCSTSDMCGTASDTGGTGLGTVRLSVQRNSNSLYWNGTSFGSSNEVLLNASGTTAWTAAFAATRFTTDGSYTVRVQLTDAGGTSSVTAYTFTMDQTAPVAPTLSSVPPNVTNSTSASFGFTHTEPGVTFACRLDAGTATACTSPTSYTGLAAGNHTFAVTATDTAGNTSTAATDTWTVDTTAPTTGYTAPGASATYSASTYTALCGTPAVGDVCGTAADTGGGSVASVAVSLQSATTSLYWDGSAFASAGEVRTAATGAGSWNWSFPSANFPADGSYVLRAYATDTAGNTGTATSRTFTIDTTAPTASFTFPTSGGSYDSAAWNAGCSTTTVGDFCGTATDSGGSTVTSVQVSVRQGSGNYWNGTSFASAGEVLLNATGTTSWTRALPAAALSAGSYTIRVVATDAVNNASSTSTTFTSGPTASYVRQFAQGGQCSGPTSTTISTPSGGSPIGRKLIAGVVLRGTVTGTVTITDVRGNTWTTDADVVNGSIRTVLLSSSLTTALQASDSVTITYPSTAGIGYAIGEWSGITAGQPNGGYDTRATSTGISNSPSVSVTPTGANDVVISVLGNTSNLTYTEASGWTPVIASSVPCGPSAFDARGSTLTGVPASSVTYNPTLSNSVTWASAVVSYRTD